MNTVLEYFFQKLPHRNSAFGKMVDGLNNLFWGVSSTLFTKEKNFSSPPPKKKKKKMETESEPIIFFFFISLGFFFVRIILNGFQEGESSTKRRNPFK